MGLATTRGACYLSYIRRFVWHFRWFPSTKKTSKPNQFGLGEWTAQKTKEKIVSFRSVPSLYFKTDAVQLLKQQQQQRRLLIPREK